MLSYRLMTLVAFARTSLVLPILFPRCLPKPTCERCGTTKGVEMESSRTCRVTEKGYWDDVANRKLSLCRDCAAEHHDNWDAQWADYYSGLL